MTRMGFLAIALTAFVAIGCNRSNTASNGSVGTTGDTDRNEVKAADTAFVNDLVIGNMAEVELGGWPSSAAQARKSRSSAR